MAESSDVSTGQQANADQHNKLRDDVWQYVEMTSINYKDGNGAWTDWDLSSLVPVGTKMVFIEARHITGTASASDVGARQNGSSLDWKTGLIGCNTATGATTSHSMIAGVDSNRIVEIYGSSNIRFYLKGYIASIGA